MDNHIPRAKAKPISRSVITTETKATSPAYVGNHICNARMTITGKITVHPGKAGDSPAAVLPDTVTLHPIREAGKITAGQAGETATPGMPYTIAVGPQAATEKDIPLHTMVTTTKIASLSALRSVMNMKAT